ncbi:MAG: hybrid sensor histidine kinase/response regulator [Burkholderiales bacterium]
MLENAVTSTRLYFRGWRSSDSPSRLRSGTAAMSLQSESHADAPNLSPERRAQVRAEQVRTLYYQAPSAVLGSNVFVPILLSAVFWSSISRPQLVAWLAAMGATAAGRIALVRAYRRAIPASMDVLHWHRRYTLGAAVSGSLWGLAGALFFVPGSPEYQVILGLVLGGLCTSSVAAQGAHLPTFYAFALPTMLPYVARSLTESGRIHLTVAALALIYLVAMCFFARNFNRTLMQSWALRFENIDLVAELTAKKEEAERANVAKSRFLAAASHDLRQPLHALSLLASALTGKVQHPETRQVVDEINLSVESLESLFNALLDISKLDAGVVVAERTDHAVQVLFEKLQREYAAEAHAKGLRLRLMPSRMVLYSDPTLMERILRNLISNAMRYTDAGGVVVGCRRRGENVRIEVWDSGPGIAPLQHREIFQEFYQIGNPERDRRKGLGLGLAIVDRLARLLGHTIELRSVVGRGSVFAVTLPRSHRTPAVPPAAGRTEAGIDLTGACVVVVDDEPAVLNGMGAILRDWGCRPILADSVEAALAQLPPAGPPPDAIIADYRLRAEQTGVQAIARIQSVWNARVPAAIVTGDTAPDRLREAQASGYRLLHKPVRPAILRSLLCDLIRK